MTLSKVRAGSKVWIDHRLYTVEPRSREDILAGTVPVLFNKLRSYKAAGVECLTDEPQEEEYIWPIEEPVKRGRGKARC